MHADDLKNLLDALGVDKIHLVGLSNGGHDSSAFRAQLFSHAKFFSTSGYILLYVDKLLELMTDTWIKATEIGGNEFRYDMALPVIFSESFIRNNEENLAHMKENNIAVNSSTKAVINLVRATAGHNLLDRVSDIKCPTLIIVGEEDILIPLRHSKILHEKIKDSELITIKNCGHVPSIEKPAEFNEIVYGFLSKVSSA